MALGNDGQSRDSSFATANLLGYTQNDVKVRNDGPYNFFSIPLPRPSYPSVLIGYPEVLTGFWIPAEGYPPMSIGGREWQNETHPYNFFAIARPCSIPSSIVEYSHPPYLPIENIFFLFK